MILKADGKTKVRILKCGSRNKNHENFIGKLSAFFIDLGKQGNCYADEIELILKKRGKK